jgi:hypothetical protein
VIAPHILVISILGSIIWGWHTKNAAIDYRQYRTRADRQAPRLADKFRDLICAVCLLSIFMAYVVRTAFVLAGAGEVAAGQIAFFTIMGVNIPGGIFVVVSKRLG